ncbi:nicotinamide N-methyltransferase-like [Alligator mississippiensis]|uniref:nicotinamide N-methyltransferase-like n=1 Tax=Alligator mississippiensis TaxID=8496 RepID=UPI00287809FF|nr:nicotinamide N-methyltransferase-like [Alligator mississippiensis]
MAAFTGGEVYKAEFEPTAYLEYFKIGGGTLGDEFLTFVLKHYCKTFTSGHAAWGRGDDHLEPFFNPNLTDIGSGPTIYQLLSACESFKEIIASDYIDQNCQELLKWLKNEPGAFDWTPVVQHVRELEGDRNKWAEKERNLRGAIKHVLKCDVHESNPLDPVVLPPADCLVSSLCLEAACKDQSSYRAALRNISSLLKPGGHLVLSGDLGTSFYVEFDVLSRDDDTMQEICHFSGMYFIVAHKEKAI